MSGPLLIAGGSILVVMGLVHGLVSLADVFRPAQFAPAISSAVATACFAAAWWSR